MVQVTMSGRILARRDRPPESGKLEIAQPLAAQVFNNT